MAYQYDIRTDQMSWIKSAPIPVSWMGWRSDTATLGRNGWEVSAEQDVATMRMRLALQHRKAEMRALSESVDFDYQRIMRDAVHSLPMLRFDWLHSNVQVHTIFDNVGAFQPVNPFPHLSAHSGPISKLEDLIHFATLPQQKLIIPDQSIDELMQRILEKQSGARLLRIEDEVRWDIAQKPRFHAQIISLAA